MPFVHCVELEYSSVSRADPNHTEEELAEVEELMTPPEKVRTWEDLSLYTTPFHSS